MFRINTILFLKIIKDYQIFSNYAEILRWRFVTLIEEITALGHQNIIGTHKTTFEITKERDLTKRGNCIIGILANKGIVDLSQRFKDKAKTNIKIKCVLIVKDIIEEIFGYGHPSLTFLHPTDIVIRKSNYKCSRTLMIKANKSANDLDRNLIKLLKNPETQLKLKFVINS
ncbi:MAG: DUF371 domain-containing protein [Candidatus Helarchaeota archaeon]|nr:DUF371 domain-containing protein [Candidatus Helarchaeota archaeon]